MLLTGEFLEVVEGQRLAFTDVMADENGQPVPADQLPPGHPESTTVTVELSAMASGTRTVMTHEGVAPGSPGAGGWRMAFDKLAEYLGTF